jgi:hypothetical protein
MFKKSTKPFKHWPQELEQTIEAENEQGGRDYGDKVIIDIVALKKSQKKYKQDYDYKTVQ